MEKYFFYRWQVFYDGRLIKEFKTFPEMFKFYKKFKSVLARNERDDVTYSIHWYL